MEQRLISKTNEQCTFLISDNNINFYLIIPNNRHVSILLSIYKNPNDELIKNLKIDKDKAIVIPVIDSQVLTNANILNDTAIKYLDSVMSYLINKSYQILSYNHIEVEKKILILNTPSYYNYVKRYSEVYASRVEIYNEVKEEVSIIPTNTPVAPTSEELPTKEPLAEQSDVAGHEPGFVSYVLLGVLVAVISLVFLYLIL